jgi:hypothetical protein
VAVRIVEERHPQIVVVHPRDQMRRMGEDNSTALQLRRRQGDVSATEVDDDALSRRRSIAGWRSIVRWRSIEQQPYPGAIEKAQVSEAVELPQPDDGFVELSGAVDIGDGQSDLPDLVEIQEQARLLRSIMVPADDVIWIAPGLSSACRPRPQECRGSYHLTPCAFEIKRHREGHAIFHRSGLIDAREPAVIPAQAGIQGAEIGASALDPPGQLSGTTRGHTADFLISTMEAMTTVWSFIGHPRKGRHPGWARPPLSRPPPESPPHRSAVGFGARRFRDTMQ